MEKKKSLAQWQIIYPDAIRIQMNANTLFSNEQLVYHATNGRIGKVLQDSSHATWNIKGGVKAKINAIVSVMAASDTQKQ